MESLAVSWNFPFAESFFIDGCIVGPEMSKSKSALLSIVCGIFITIALTCAAFLIDNKYISGALLWQVTLIVYLTGPGTLLGYDEHGSPRYEGTPLHLLILPFGLFMGGVIYSIIIYFILRAVLNRRSR
jgi:hypothetical protein